MFNALISRLADITVTPDYDGLPSNLHQGLVHLTNNAAAVMMLVSGLGIVMAVGGLVVGHVLHRQHITERSWSALGIAAGAGAILFIAVHAANYTTGLFR